MSWKDKLFTLIGKRFISKEEYFNEDGHRYVLINNPYIAVLKSECPPNTSGFDNDFGEYYVYSGGTQIDNFYLYYLPHSVKHIYQCFGTTGADLISDYKITIDISSPIGFFAVTTQQEI